MISDPETIFPSLSTEFDKAFQELVKKHHIAAEELTERQLAEAFKQALACGDFQLHVRASDGAQAVSYVPYRECEHLRSQIKDLEARLKEVAEEASDKTIELDLLT